MGMDIVCSKKPTRTHWLGTTRGKAPFSTGGAQRGPLECIICIDHSFEFAFCHCVRTWEKKPKEFEVRKPRFSKLDASVNSATVCKSCCTDIRLLSLPTHFLHRCSVTPGEPPTYPRALRPRGVTCIQKRLPLDLVSERCWRPRLAEEGKHHLELLIIIYQAGLVQHCLGNCIGILSLHWGWTHQTLPWIILNCHTAGSDHVCVK